MAKRKVIALDQQTAVDIAVQEHGSVEALFTVAQENAVTDPAAHLVPGQALNAIAAPLTPDVSRFFAARSHKPVTGEVLPMFFCVGPQCFPVKLIESGTLAVYTSTGYVAVRLGSSLVVHGDGTPADIYVEHEPGAHCIYPVNEEGELEGTIATLLTSANADWWSFKWLSDLQALQFLANLKPTIDLRNNPLLEFADLYGAGTKRLLIPEENIISSLRLLGFGCDNTDQVVNNMNPAIANGELYLADGSVPRTSASDDVYDALSANGWTLNVP